MRTGLIMSGIAHGVLLLGLVAFATQTPSEPVPTRSIAVDIVSPEEVAQGSKAESSKSAPQPQQAPQPEADSAAPSSQAQRAPQPEANSASTSETPPIEPAIAATTAPSPFYFSLLTPSTEALAEGFDAPAVMRAKLSAEDIAAFRAHLQKCWKQRIGADAGKLQVVIRVSLNRGGALTAEPILIEASASPYGPALVESAKRTLRQCQPYGFLPADKFEEWRTLDLRFTARGLAGG
jgi:hypothetical protein